MRISLKTKSLRIPFSPGQSPVWKGEGKKHSMVAWEVHIKWMSEWLLFNTNWEIFQLFHCICFPLPDLLGWGRCGWTIYILSYIFSKVLNITINVWLYTKEQYRLLRLTLFLRFTSAAVSKNSIVKVNNDFAIFHNWTKYKLRNLLYKQNECKSWV